MATVKYELLTVVFGNLATKAVIIRNDYCFSSDFAIYNFSTLLPDKQSDLAVKTMKNPYIFDFVNMREKMIEADIEHELVNNVSKLLLELGTGFAFVGEQYLIKVDDNEFYIDLLFTILSFIALWLLN